MKPSLVQTPSLVRVATLFVAVVVLLGLPRPVQAEPADDATTTTTTTGALVGSAVTPSDPTVWLSRSAARQELLRSFEHPNTTWHATIASHPSVNFREFTAADVKAMFGTRVCDTDRVAEGLPRLNNEMRQGRVVTPARQAAFLATMAHESCLDYAKTEAGVSAYYEGRGYVQLTGEYNYAAAGDYFDVNLPGNPHLAASLEWSAPIARWYWTVQRPHSNLAADNFDMGLISRYVGYAPSSLADAQRCTSFKNAYTYITGKPAPFYTICYRH